MTFSVATIRPSGLEMPSISGGGRQNRGNTRHDDRHLNGWSSSNERHTRFPSLIMRPMNDGYRPCNMLQNASALDKKHSACFSEGNSSCRTVEELSADAAFQVTDLTTKRRLRDVERPGCAAKM